MNQIQPGGFSVLPPVIKNLLIINGLVWLATLVLAMRFGIDLIDILGLYYPTAPSFQPYQLVTHLFMHSIGTPGKGINFSHVLFNMFALWMFGSAIENIWGSKRFLIYYLVCGLGAAILYLAVNGVEIYFLKSSLESTGADLSAIKTAQTFQELQNIGNPLIQQYGLDPDDIVKLWSNYITPIVGASGAVFGILLAFGLMFPNSYIYLFFAIPIKAKWFVLGYGAAELCFGFSNNPGDNVAHFAHVGGMLFGFLLIRLWKSRGELR